jgi:hypothetical protein
MIIAPASAREVRAAIGRRGMRHATVLVTVATSSLFGAMRRVGGGTLALERRFVHGCGAVAGVLRCYAPWGATAVAAGPVWRLGMAMPAHNFGVWAFARELLP